MLNNLSLKHCCLNSTLSSTQINSFSVKADRWPRPEGIDERFENHMITEDDRIWVKCIVTSQKTKAPIRQDHIRKLIAEFNGCQVLQDFHDRDRSLDVRPNLERPEGLENRWNDPDLRTQEDTDWVNLFLFHPDGSELGWGSVNRAAIKYDCSILEEYYRNRRRAENVDRKSYKDSIQPFIGQSCNYDMPEGFDDRYASLNLTDGDKLWLASELYHENGWEKSSESLKIRSQSLNCSALLNESQHGPFCFRTVPHTKDFASMLYRSLASSYYNWCTQTLKLQEIPFPFETVLGATKEEFCTWIEINLRDGMIFESYGRRHVEKGDPLIYHTQVYQGTAPSWELGHVFALYWWNFMNMDPNNRDHVRQFWCYTNLLPVTKDENSAMRLKNNRYARTELTSSLIFSSEIGQYVNRTTNNLPLEFPIPLESVQPSNYTPDITWPVKFFGRED